MVKFVENLGVKVFLMCKSYENVIGIEKLEKQHETLKKRQEVRQNDSEGKMTEKWK